VCLEICNCHNPGKVLVLLGIFYMVSKDIPSQEKQELGQSIIHRVVQSCIHTPCMTACMVITLLEIPYIHCIPHTHEDVWF
jgi:Fe-S-cluster-containing dehydrogenase component